jgi:hypothetical protein
MGMVTGAKDKPGKKNGLETENRRMPRRRVRLEA